VSKSALRRAGETKRYGTGSSLFGSDAFFGFQVRLPLFARMHQCPATVAHP
jgi:hypothetical protein